MPADSTDFNLATSALVDLGKVKPKDSASNAALTSAKGRVRSIRDRNAPPPPVEPPAPPASTFDPDLFLGDGLEDFPASTYAIQPRHNSKLVQAPDGSGDLVWEQFVGNDDGVVLEHAGKREVLDPQGEAYSGDPRAQLLSPGFSNSKEIWWGGAYWLPTDFPAIPAGGWVNLAEGPYAPPWNGSPPVEIDIRSDGVGWQTNEYAPTPWKTYWRIPLVRGKKHTYLIHVIPSAEPGHGLVEMWHDGVRMISTSFAAIDASNKTGPQHYIDQLYYKRGMFGGKVVRAFKWPMALGTKRELVEYPLPGS